MSKLKCLGVFVLSSIFNLQSISTGYACQPIHIPFCAQIGYKSAIFPNSLNHKSQIEAASELYRFAPLSISKCSADLEFFICSIYMPMCNMLGIPIPPCKSLCLSVKKNCTKVMKQSGFDWPKIFDCNGYPEMNSTSGILCLEKDPVMGTSETKDHLMGTCETKDHLMGTNETKDHLMGTSETKGHSKFDGTLVFSNLHQLVFVDTTTFQLSPIPLPHDSIASGLAIDYETERIIFSNYRLGTINSIFFNGTGHTVLTTGQGHLRRIEFDQVERVLYWVEHDATTGGHAINYMKLTKQGTKASNVRTLLGTPKWTIITDIAVDECEKIIFWAQLKEARTNYIFKTDLMQVKTEAIILCDNCKPWRLTIDYEMRHIYWANPSLNLIERSDYDGRHKSVIISGDRARSVTGMTIYGSNLYWIEQYPRVLYRADKITGANITALADNQKLLVDVVAVVNNVNKCDKKKS